MRLLAVIGMVLLFMVTFFPGLAQAEPILTSCYGAESGTVTASGESFNPWGFTAASPWFPFDTHLLVTYGDAQVEVVVNDRGPFVAGRGLDLSIGACQTIGLDYVGVDVVDVQIIG